MLRSKNYKENNEDNDGLFRVLNLRDATLQLIRSNECPFRIISHL
jgi:hypothetical protein